MSDTKHDGLPRCGRKEVRQVAEQLAKMGAVFDGYDAVGHAVVKAGSEYVTLPMTPRGQGWRKATIWRVRKALGIKPDKMTRPRFRGYETGFKMPSGEQRSEYVDELYDKHARLSAALSELTSSPSWKSAGQARSILGKLLRTEAELRQLYQAEPADGWYFSETDLENVS